MRNLFILIMMFASLTMASADTEWEANWISVEQSQSTVNTWLAYRKTVNLDKIPEALIAKIAADTKYWLWINGEMVVFEGGLKRGPMPGATYFDTVDIAPYLKEGENTLAVLVWHFGKNGFSHVNSGTAALLFEAVGSGVKILSDKSWKCKIHAAYQNTGEPSPNFRLPESNIRFDARQDIDGWTGANPNSWFHDCLIVAPAGAPPFGRLVERPIPMWKTSGLEDYISKRQCGDSLICRLPYNCQATPYLKIKSEAGKKIEMLTDNYRVCEIPTIRAEYITRAGEQEYENFGWMNGHEMIYIVPEGVEVISLKFRESGYDTQLSGDFCCNDSLLNELWKRAQRTLYLTMRDTYMDCPDRERAQWFGDETIELEEAFYGLSTSSQALALKGINEVIDWQRADGTFFGPCPTGNYFVELPLQMLAYVGWYGFYSQYFYSGDMSFVTHSYEPVRRYLHEVWELDETGFPKMRKGEWEWGDWGKNIDMEMLTTCWYYLALKAERAFALELGKEGDAEEDREMMSRIETNFDDRYWKGDSFRSDNYQGETDDRSQAMAVLAGLASPDKYSSLTEVLKKEFHASPYMEKYVLEALFVMGEPDFAIERMRSRYSCMIERYPHLTTLFEGWDADGGSVNHAWTGGPLTLMSKYICGIMPTSPGFKSFKVCPNMGSLTDVSATVDTQYGKIKVSLTRRKKGIEVTMDVPDGSMAEIALPDGGVEKYGRGHHHFSL